MHIGQLLHQHHLWASLGASKDLILPHVPSAFQTIDLGQVGLLFWTVYHLGLLHCYLYRLGILPGPRRRSNLARRLPEPAIHEHPTHDHADCFREPYFGSVHLYNSTDCVVETAPHEE